ncbi:cupin domain-containing protein [Comamonas sp. JUb58]|uniref:cupin domain-containing protein n=1 Tax=Comamonas sp. JUb58 TaxID=2485114 RepID=UPI00105F2886|nr:cupin domain-containing protein [Comamonas sp. JUb58]TDS83692.1 ChrR-like anti-ECFsigma factor [Comamonas sp. JUb58]
MHIHADLNQAVHITPCDYQWTPSPLPGVERMMLDRVGAEVARATSLVRYAPGSHFSAHQHPGGEEILVLSGVFSDETGDYPRGWYSRNPPQSAHRPHTEPGALIFVKLQQMRPDDTAVVRINALDRANWHQADGRDTCLLFQNDEERVYTEQLPDQGRLLCDASGGLELLVLAGALVVQGQHYPEGSWLRLPAGSQPQMEAVGDTMVFVKTGHLAALARRGAPC